MSGPDHGCVDEDRSDKVERVVRCGVSFVGLASTDMGDGMKMLDSPPTQRPRH